MNAAANVIGSGIVVAVLYAVIDQRRELGPKLTYGFYVGAAMGAMDSYMSTVYPETK